MSSFVCFLTSYLYVNRITRRGLRLSLVTHVLRIFMIKTEKKENKKRKKKKSLIIIRPLSVEGRLTEGRPKRVVSVPFIVSCHLEIDKIKV
uniref:Uncharacterized protein n=1 Tax=Caenorhabditis japonica TaxID=281687 RepID=A0A8R1HWS4_CAEJA